jgi:hypothetical protein
MKTTARIAALVLLIVLSALASDTGAKSFRPPAFALTFTIRILTPPGVFFRTAASAGVPQPNLIPVYITDVNSLRRHQLPLAGGVGR